MKLLIRGTTAASKKYRRRDVPIAVDYHRFEPGQTYFIGARDREHVLILLSGRLTAAGDVSAVLERKGVFQDGPAAVYVGPQRRITVHGDGCGEFILVSGAACGEGVAEVVSGVPGQRRGRDGYQRTVYDIIPETFPAQRLVVGETINDAGNWSSFPPHKHDRNASDEVAMQEVYFFKVDPENGFGFQRLYGAPGIDETYTIRNNDLVWIPAGYHPVAVMPGHRIYYLWALSGDSRQLKPRTADEYLWLL